MEADSTTSYRSESPPQDERKKRKVWENITERPQKEEEVPMEIQVEQLLKHLLLDNRELHFMLEFIYKTMLVRKKAVLFDILFSKRYRKEVFAVLERSRFSNKFDALHQFIDLLGYLWRINPELKKGLYTCPSFSRLESHVMEHVAAGIIFHPIRKIMEHLLLENPELDWRDLGKILFSGRYEHQLHNIPEGGNEDEEEFQVEQLMQHLLLGNPELDRGGMLDILYLRSAQEKKDHLENLLLKLLEHLLLENPELDKEDLLDILFYKRFRSEVLNILPRIQKKMKDPLKVLDSPDLDKGDVLYSERPELPLGMQVENLLNDVLAENSKLDKEGLLDVLYSKRYREKLNQMLSIVERMDLGHDQQPYDVVSSDDEILRELGKAVSRLAAGRMRLRLCDLSWHPSICYPLPRDSICDDKPWFQAPWDILYRELEWAVVSGRAAVSGRGNVDVASSNDVTDSWEQYGEQTDVDVATNDVSDSPDVVSLLSLGGTLVDPTGEQIVLEPDTFKRKYVMVCCIDAPALFGIDISCQSLLNLCNELSSERADVKMVMVARMNILADTKEVFDHLFSGFPTSCLAIPYEDWERRERACKLLKCSAYLIRCSVYDTDGFFLTSFCVDASENPYGAEAFPFTGRRLKETDTERKRLRNDSLDKLLRPYESSPDTVVYKLGSPQEKISISEVIKDKHVGLYVCCGGSFIPHLQKLYLQCKEKAEEFEIVVLYLPLLSEVDPDLFKEKIECWLRKQNISGWWCLPFNNSVSLRVWGLTMDYDCGYNGDEMWKDKLIIVGPEGKILDMYGRAVIGMYVGFDEYPFTREAVVKKKMREVREVRLETLLEGQLFRGDNPSDTISAEMLLSRQKKIIIFMGHPQMHVVHGRHYAFDSEGFVSEYKGMKGRGVEFEVVFIEYPSEYEYVECEFADWNIFVEGGGGVGEGEVGGVAGGSDEEFADMPPYIHPRDEEYADMPWYIHRSEGTFTPLAEKLEELVGHESLVGFGEDGRICSVKLLYKTTGGGPCLEDTLEQDIRGLMNIDNFGNI